MSMDICCQSKEDSSASLRKISTGYQGQIGPLPYRYPVKSVGLVQLCARRTLAELKHVFQD
jgi:hypothetical protein